MPFFGFDYYCVLVMLLMDSVFALHYNGCTQKIIFAKKLIKIVDKNSLKNLAVRIFLADLGKIFFVKKTFFGHPNQWQTKFMVI